MSKRNYKKEYRDFHGKPEEIKKRASRNKARAIMIKKGKLKKNDPRHVDHKDHNPYNNNLSNLRVRNASANKADNHHKKK